MTTKNGAAVGIYAGAGETDAAYPWADPTSKLKDITIDPDDSVTRAIDEAAACERERSSPDLIQSFLLPASISCTGASAK